jgi:succinoglycan biosynthesis protein ExoM
VMMPDRPQDLKSDHISVCICTYKRPQMLSNLLSKLEDQVTENLFTYSAVVVDNDASQSGKDAVTVCQDKSLIKINYFCEPQQNIALARNKAVENAKGNFIAFIDDDEFPEATWLLHLYKALRRFNADAVLGPVIPHYPADAPEWLIKSKMCERPSHKTGTILYGSETRTGNVLMDMRMFENSTYRFDSKFGRTGGEDITFFSMMEKKGKVYVWCEEAPVYETVPPERWSKEFYIKRNLRIGSLSGTGIHRRDDFLKSAYAFGKSAAWITVTTLFMPFSRLFGEHIYVRNITKLIYNIGLVSGLMSRPIIRDRDD